MTAAVALSAPAASARTTGQKELDAALEVLKSNARTFARMGVMEKASLLRSCIPLLVDVAPEWVAAGNAAKQVSSDSPEEWLAGVAITVRNARLLSDSLEQIAKHGRPGPDDAKIKTRQDGRVTVDVFPTDAYDGVLFAGFHVYELMEKGLTKEKVRERQASFYKKKDPEGGVALILGAGNVSSIPPTDAFYKLFAEGLVTLVKVNPVNEWVGPMLEKALKPIIDKGFLRIVYGGGDVGAHLVNHPAVDDIHITGSNITHDLIVWGPPGPERERRMREKDPVLKKRITSELGNVSPVAITPHDYSDGELDFVARNVVAMVTNNGSFNCNAAKILVTSKQWTQRDRFLARVAELFGEVQPRYAYYPGAQDRYARLTEGRETKKIGQVEGKRLPWTIIRNVDSSKKDDPIFRDEPFCSIISETTLDAKDPAEFIRAFTRFANETLWGTLNAAMIVPPKLEHSQEVARAVDQAIVDLEYGTVAINHWPAVVYATVSPAWGGHPSATLEDIQSGLGWVHNTFLLEGIEKSVLRGPLTLSPRPVWFDGNKTAAEMGRKLVAFEASPSWLRVPGLALTALRG